MQLYMKNEEAKKKTSIKIMFLAVINELCFFCRLIYCIKNIDRNKDFYYSPNRENSGSIGDCFSKIFNVKCKQEERAHCNYDNICKEHCNSYVKIGLIFFQQIASYPGGDGERE